MKNALTNLSINQAEEKSSDWNRARDKQKKERAKTKKGCQIKENEATQSVQLQPEHTYMESTIRQDMAKRRGGEDWGQKNKRKRRSSLSTTKLG